MPNGIDPIQAEINRLLGRTAPADPIQAEISRLLSVGPVQPEGTGRGFFARAVDAITPQSREEFQLLTSGAIAPIFQGAQALSQLPGFFTSKELPTDRAADFFGRLSEGILARSEQAALDAGVSPELIADSHLLGEIFGYTVPVVASLKAARLITGIRGATTALSRNFILDSTAGAIFGGILTPGETIGERTEELLTQSAVFGVTGLALNGLIFAARGMRLNRARVRAGDADLEGLLSRIEKGEQVVPTEVESIALVHLMNEEGFLANSPAAQRFMGNLEFDNALVASVKGMAEAGQTRGLVQEFGTSLRDIDARLPAIREQFPGLKFDITRRGNAFDLHFGQKGLNNVQKRELARQGRYNGQIIEKGGTTYEYLRPGKEGRLIVRTADKKVTTIKEEGVSSLPYGTEEITLPTAGQALYTDFREFVDVRIKQAMGVEGPLDETLIVKGLREGTLRFSDDEFRQFEIGGAITHSEELGIRPSASAAEEFAQDFMQRGKYAGDFTEPVASRNLDHAFSQWAEERGLGLNAVDIDAFRANFAQRYRSDLWAALPEEDLAIFQSIREETLALAEDAGLDLRAGTKGLHVERLPDGRVSLRDINTGATREFGSEAIASDVIDQVIRSEVDPFGLFDSIGPHGMPGYTSGFSLTDGIFSFADDVVHQDFISVADTPTAIFRNRRDYFDSVERLTGVPLFSQGFGAIDLATTKAAQRFEPIGRRIDKAWKGLNRDQRVAVAEFWTSIEGKDLKGVALRRAATEAGLNSKQLLAFNESRNLFDLGAQELGLPESRYITNYYSRIRPALAGGEKSNAQIRELLKDDPAAIREWEFWATKQRTGELSQLELDPLIVMNSYFRSLFRELEVAPLEKKMKDMLELRIRDLPKSKQQEIFAKSLPRTDQNSFVLPDDIRAVGEEYMVSIQGNYGPGFASSRRFMTRMFGKLGIKSDPQVFDQLINTYLAVQYGGALGLRFSSMNRNAMQNMWTMYTRVGGKFGGDAHRIAMTQVGYDAAAHAGAIRPHVASVGIGDAVFENLLGGNPITGSGPWSNAVASAVHRSLRAGRMTRNAAEKILIPYGSGDQINRSIAFHWQRLHTQDILKKFDAGRISWDLFLEDGLPFFSNSIKTDFRARFDKFGREAALDWIGKQAADEAHFIYGVSASPTWMQRPFGRLIGVFGQWPLWLSDLYFRRTAHATRKQQIQFSVRTLSLMGLIGNMGFQAGVNMWSWMAPTSLGFGGGPFVDVMLDMKNIVDAPIDRKAEALKRMTSDIGSLSFPGQQFYRDIESSLDENVPSQMALRLLLGRTVDNRNFAYDLLTTPPIDQEDPGMLPVSSLPSIESLLGIP